MVVHDAVWPNMTMPVAVNGDQLTSPRTPSVKSRQERAVAAGPRRRWAPRTDLDIDPAERGDEEEQNKAGTSEVDQGRTEKEPERAEDAEGGRVRSERARDLVQRVSQLLPLVGDVSLATHISLLKRDLSRCHDALKDYPDESNYLSIITLVESAMTQLKWKPFDLATDGDYPPSPRHRLPASPGSLRGLRKGPNSLCPGKKSMPRRGSTSNR